MQSRLIWAESAAVIMGLVILEIGALLVELRSSVILDWFVSLAPLIWINVSVMFVYALFRHLRASGSDGRGTRAAQLLHPDFSSLRRALARPTLKLLWVGFGFAYAIGYMLLQGILVVDLTGRLEPVFIILESPVGYGPGLAWSSSAGVALLLRPYTLAAAVALSLLSGLVLTVFAFLVKDGRRSLRPLPGPLAGLGVMCPACFATPAAGLLLAYLAPAAALAGLGTLPLFSATLAISTILLVASLLLLWVTAAWLSRMISKVV